MKLKNLKISSLVNPKGITKPPYFSYTITSDKKDVKQIKYAITVSDNSGKVVWNSEENTSQSTFINYEGELLCQTEYFVNINVTDNYGETDSINGTFETAFLKNSDWLAKWVKSTLPVFKAEKGFGKQPPATMFKRGFSCNGQIKSARLYCTCHGIYIPYLNGEVVDKRQFAPEHSTYEKVLFYQTYDITNLLQQGKNEISLYVGDGWYLGVKTQPRLKDFERVHAILYQIEILFNDGTKQTVYSDGTEMCAYGSVISSDLFAGEKYDANLKFDNWQKAEAADYGYDNLVADGCGGVVCTKEIPVQNVITTPKGETVLDFGRVISGRLSVVIDENKGSTVVFTHSEALDKDGNFFLTAQMPDGGVEQRDEYISDGKKRVYEPLFTYHGFRYVKVEGVTNLNAENYVAKVYSSENKNSAFFTCSNERLNKLYKNIRNSQHSNMLSIPTDCPQREKAGWTGDIAIYAYTALLNGDFTAFFNRWLLSVRADQGANGAVPIVVPYDGGYPMSEYFFGPMYEETGTIGSAGWGDCCVYVPWAVYSATGNTNILKDNFDVMERWCTYILDRCKLPCKTKSIDPETDKFLWNRGYHQGDWLVPSLNKEPPVDEIADQLRQMNFTMQYAAPMYACNTFSIMDKIAVVLGDIEKSSYYNGVSEKMRQAIQAELFDENGNLPTNLMGAYVLAVAFDLVPEKFKAIVSQKLVNLLHDNGDCLDTGFLSTPYLLTAYQKIGRADLAYKILYQTKCPSWLYEVEHGATAVWESWNSYDSDGNPRKISFNHYAFGCVDEWIFANICGITPLEHGFKSFKIQPDINCGLNYVKRVFESVYGEIRVEWERQNGVFIINCKIPCNTTAKIVMPSGKQFDVGSGKYTFEEKYE